MKFFVERPAATENGFLIDQRLVEAAAVIDESFRILCCVISLASRTASRSSAAALPWFAAR